jgi:hypothetical protein
VTAVDKWAKFQKFTGFVFKIPEFGSLVIESSESEQLKRMILRDSKASRANALSFALHRQFASSSVLA